MKSPDQLDRIVDDIIDQTFAALRSAEPSPTLEGRTLAALERHAQAEPRRKNGFLWPVLFTATACALAAALLLHHPAPPVQTLTSHLVPRANPLPDSATSNLKPQPDPLDAPSSTLQARPNPTPAVEPVLDPQAALALAETLAPSQLAPPAPFTSDERLLLQAARAGKLSSLPILAELQPAREAALRSALETRQKLAIQQYIERMMAPLAAAESINPTTDAPAETHTEAPAPQSAEPNQP